MRIRPGKERLVVRVRPRPEREDSKIIRLERSEVFEGGDVLEVGPGCHGVQVGDLVIFHRGHLHIGSQAHSLRWKLKEISEEEELMVLKWFDVFFVVEPGEGVELDGVLWKH